MIVHHLLMLSFRQKLTIFGGALLVLLYSADASSQNLKNIVLESLSSHPQILSAIEESMALDRDGRQTSSAIFPTLVLDYESGTRDIEPIIGANTSLEETDLNIIVTQPIFAGGNLFNLSSRSSGKAQSQVGFYNLKSTINAISLQATEAYLELERAQLSFAVSRINITKIASLFSKIREQTEIDPGQGFLLFRAQNRLSLAREEFINNERALLVARVRMAYILGRETGQLPANGYRLPKLQAVRAEAVETALNQHPDVRAAGFTVRRSRADARIASGGLFPQINLVHEQRSAENTGGSVGELSETFTGLNASYPISLGGAEINRSRSARHRLSSAIQQQFDTERRVKELVQISWEGYRLFEKRLATLERFFSATKSERDAYNEQFEAGQRTLIELLNIEFEAFLANSRLLQASYDRSISAYRLLAAMGELTDEFIDPEQAIERLRDGESLFNNN